MEGAVAPTLASPDTTPAGGEVRPWMVFLPGLGGTTRYYHDRVASLAATHRLLFVDLLGFGRSPRPDGAYTVDRHIAALRGAIAGRGPVVLVGHSFGARLAVTYAARYPAEVSHVVLLSAPYYPTPTGRDSARAHFARRSRWTRAAWTRPTVTRLLCTAAHRVLAPAMPRLVRGLPRDVVRDGLAHSTQAAVSSLYDALYGYDLTPDVDRLTGTMALTLVHGARDPTAPVAGARALAARHPSSRLLILPDADHHPLLRAPAAVLPAIAAGATACAAVTACTTGQPPRARDSQRVPSVLRTP